MARNIIVMNRGDTFEFNLTITDDNGLDYKLVENDAIYFGIMDPHQPFEQALVKKKFTLRSKEIDEAGNISLCIKPEDTIDLMPGVYYYAVKLYMQHKGEPYFDYSLNKIVRDPVDKVVTIINKTKLVIND